MLEIERERDGDMKRHREQEYLKMLERSPSVQSLVTGSRTPYSSITGRSLGLMTKSLVLVPSLVGKHR